MTEDHANILKAAGLSDHAVVKANLFGLPPGTIVAIIAKYGPLALQIIEELLTALEGTSKG